MRSLKLLLAIILCLCLPVLVSAHPGRTDYYGGHYDHSEGEYHYHHGYSAHQHYDKDGDGIVDCPYSFDDKTNSSGNHSGSYTFSKTPSDKNESSQDDTALSGIKNESKKETAKKKTVSDYFDIICYGMFGLFILIAILEGVVDKIRKRRKK